MANKLSYEELERRVLELEERLSPKEDNAVLKESTELFEKIFKSQQDARETIKRSEERYRLVTERTSDMVSITTFSSEPRYIYINPSHEAILGYKPEDLIGKCAFDFIHPEDSQRLIPLLGSYITAKSNKTLIRNDKGPTETMIFRLRDLWGNWRYLETTGDLLDDDHILFISRDITKKEKLGRLLRESEERYRGLFNNALVGIFRTTITEGRILDANYRLSKMLGYDDVNEFIGDYIFSEHYVDPGTREEMLERLMERGELSGFEARFTCKGGKIIWVRCSARIFPEEGYIEGVAVDVTDEKEALAKLVDSETRYRYLVENANDAIFILQGDKIEFPNPKAKQMGREMGFDLDTKPFYEYIHPEDRAMVLERHGRRIRGEDLPSVYSFRLINDRGKERWVQLNTSMIHWEGKPSTLNFLRDITAQKTLEAELQSARRMEALGTLAGGIAHDFNNLLMGIKGRISLMLMDSDASQPYFGDLKDIEDIIRSGAELTKQLLGFSRGGRGEVRVTDLNDLIKQASELFGRTNRHIKIQSTYDKDLWAAEVDHGQLDQVLLNLFMNASEAMPGGGTLSILTKNETFDESLAGQYGVAPGRFAHVAVADTGVGMDEETLRRIFEPFFTTKGMGRGRGLGLASVYGIVKNHGGIIVASSKLGGGTTFDIYFPASEAAVNTESAPSPVPMLKGTETVLVVDDEPRVLDICQRFLKTLGYSVLTAKGGREALHAYERNKGNIDMVVLDMVMPGMGGGELFDELRAREPDLKVLISTGYSVEGEVTDLMKRGCKGYIQKPFSMRVLAGEVRRLLDEA
jgi:two-component system cell cycle sensor histidine kinase/response regulator CckA